MSTITAPCKTFCFVMLLLMLPGCITIQAIEPVITPPVSYQGDVTVPVEFVAPTMIGFRCAERGSKFLGMPGINSGACADQNLVTMPDPCMTVTGGTFAAALCQHYQTVLDGRSPEHAELSTTANLPEQITKKAQLPNQGRTAGAALFKASLQSPATQIAANTPHRDRTVEIEFATPEHIDFRCAERGAKFVDDRGSGIIACADRYLVTISNPCRLGDGGWYANVLCHEMAHANGWSASHSKRPRPRRASDSAQAILWQKEQAKRSDILTDVVEQTSSPNDSAVAVSKDLATKAPVTTSPDKPDRSVTTRQDILSDPRLAPRPVQSPAMGLLMSALPLPYAARRDWAPLRIEERQDIAMFVNY